MSPLLRLTRPKQWVKNLFVFAPVVFALEANQQGQLFMAFVAFAAFTAAAVIGYIVNDLRDIESDRKHAEKKNRPLASGAVSTYDAKKLILAIAVVLAGLMVLLPVWSSVIVVLYLAMSLAYSQWLKHVAILDVMIIALGFVLRLLAGGYATYVTVSPWMIQVTFMLSLFLGFGKRYHEITSDTGRSTRRSLTGYSSAFLDRLMTLCCGATLLSYAIYAVDAADKLHRTGFVYSILFVAFGLFRYLQQLYLHRRGGAPEETLFQDKLFLGNLIAWLLFCLWQIGGA